MDSKGRQTCPCHVVSFILLFPDYSAFWNSPLRWNCLLLSSLQEDSDLPRGVLHRGSAPRRKVQGTNCTPDWPTCFSGEIGRKMHLLHWQESEGASEAVQRCAPAAPNSRRGNRVPICQRCSGPHSQPASSLKIYRLPGYSLFHFLLD